MPSPSGYWWMDAWEGPVRPVEWEHCDESWCLFCDVSSLWSIREPKSSAVLPSAQFPSKLLMCNIIIKEGQLPGRKKG